MPRSQLDKPNDKAFTNQFTSSAEVKGSSRDHDEATLRSNTLLAQVDD